MLIELLQKHLRNLIIIHKVFIYEINVLTIQKYNLKLKRHIIYYFLHYKYREISTIIFNLQDVGEK